MVETRNFVGGMDKDSSLYDIAKGFYIDALNCTKDAVSGNNDAAVTNIVGNRLVAYTFPAGTNKNIGSFPFELRKTTLNFNYNSNGYHSITEFDSVLRTITKIFQSKTDSGGTDILNFAEHAKITSVNVYPRDEGDLLFFLDSLGRPTQMDLTKFRAGEYTPVTRDILDKGKKPPLSPPSVVYDDDTTRRTNNLRNKLFRFKYRWIYDDFEKSSFSPISIVPLPFSILDDTFTSVITNNNVIRLSANAGDKNVKSVEIALSYVEKTNVWSDFQSVVVVDKSLQGIADNADFPVAFYNDSTYPDIDINESIQLFDYTPEYANAQEMPNGNVLAYVGITEGYDKDTTKSVIITVGTVAVGSGGTLGSLNGVETVIVDNSLGQTFEIAFTGIPATGTVLLAKVQRVSDSVIFTAATYTTVAGDTANSVASAMNASFNSVNQVWFSAVSGASIQVHTTEPPNSKRIFYSLAITPPASSVDDDSIATWKWSQERTIARQYYDKKGKTNGVLYTDRVAFPAYAENGSQQPLVPYINYKINDVPPIWAYSMQFLFNKNATQYIFWQCSTVNKDEAEYMYFEVTSFTSNAEKKPTTAAVLNYSFQDGDRLRVIRNNDSPGLVFADTYDAAIEGLVVAPTIDGSPQAPDSLWLKIKKVEPFTTGITTTAQYVLEIYRPTQQAANADNEVYYEMGRQYAILNPTLPTRLHAGETHDQVVGSIPAEYNFFEGDAYFRTRTIALGTSGYATFNVMDKNFVDFYISAVSSIDGRPSIIDINARRQYYSTLIRFSEAYQANTNINGLNRFYQNNFDEYDYNFGDVMRLKVRDRYLKVFQKFKIGVVPLYGQIMKDAGGAQSLVVTDRLLNPIQYRIGNFGLTAPESLASWHFADYGCDTNKGVIWRDSNDGVIPISQLYKMNSWATTELPLRTGDFKIYGAINPKSTQYIAALEAYITPVPYFGIEAEGVTQVTNTTITVISSSDFTVDWGDGTVDSYVAGTLHPEHTYSDPYTGEIKFYFDDFSGVTSFSISNNPALGGLTVHTSEVSELSRLVTLSLSENVFLDGIVSDLPSTLESITVGYSNLTGNLSELPTVATHVHIQGGNRILGDVAGLPPAIDFLILYGDNTISGDIAGIPRTLTVLYVEGGNTLSGDVADAPPLLTDFEVKGENTLRGDVADLPVALTLLNITGLNTISGDISDAPSTLTTLILQGNNTLSGNIAGTPPLVTFLQVTGSGNLSGDIAALPSGISILNIIGANCTIDTYTAGRVWSSTMDLVNLIPTAGGLTTTEIDNLLIDLAASATTWVDYKLIIIVAGSLRSAASDGAVATLVGRGVAITIT